MSKPLSMPFAERGSPSEIERGKAFQPKFDEHGLIPAIVTESGSGVVLMFAHMNADALRLTLESGVVHFWSRSRSKLWKKGEESGNVLSVVEITTDCDQDVVCLSVNVAGNGVACHTGAKSCFYRRVNVVPGDVSTIELVPPRPPRDRSMRRD